MTEKLFQKEPRGATRVGKDSQPFGARRNYSVSGRHVQARRWTPQGDGGKTFGKRYSNHYNLQSYEKQK